MTQESEFVEELYCYDTFVAAFIVIQNAFTHTKGTQVDFILDLNHDYQKKLIKVIKRVLIIIQGNNLYLDLQRKLIPMIFAMFSVLKVREISKCSSLYDNFGENAIVHFSSPIS